MNIDIVNKMVSNKLKVNETVVAKIHLHYWKSIKEHIYSYNPQPINIANICVLHASKILVKNAILKQIYKIRAIKKSQRYSEDSALRDAALAKYYKDLRKFIAMRKTNKYTN